MLINNKLKIVVFVKLVNISQDTPVKDFFRLRLKVRLCFRFGFRLRLRLRFWFCFILPLNDVSKVVLNI